MSHVVPDLVQKVLKGQDPLHILGDGEQVRCYTYGGDLARGIRLAIESPAARERGLQPLDATADDGARAGRADLAEGPADAALRASVPFDERSAVSHDVHARIPDMSKAKRVLGFEATTTLETMLDEVVPWIRQRDRRGTTSDGRTVAPPSEGAGRRRRATPWSVPVYNEGAPTSAIFVARAQSARRDTSS